MKIVMPISKLGFDSFSKLYHITTYAADTVFGYSLLKPGLIDSGARHRLALIEGQKEMAWRTKPCRTYKVIKK